MLKRNLSLILLLYLVGCTSARKISEHGQYESINYSAGIEQYFLSDIPNWINFSEVGQCKREAPLRYLNFQNLKNSFDFNYEQSVSLQHMFNRKLLSYSETSILNKDEAFIFYNMYEKVLGGTRDFIAPSFDKVSAVWIDPYLQMNKSHSRIKQAFKGRVLEGHPVLVTMCLNSIEAEKLVTKLKLDELGVKIISAEMFNTFGEGYRGFSLNLQKMLSGKNIILYSTSKPKNILGVEQFIKL